MKKQKSVLIAPSMLACDFGRLAAEAKRAQAAGADLLHLDIMDGHFVPNITFGPQAVKCIRNAVDIALDVHLMLKHPQDFIRQFAEAGADIITVHVESRHKVKNTLDAIKDLRCRPGLVLNPDTKLKQLRPYINEVDFVLFMSVYPGFGNQKFIPEVLLKVKQLREMKPEIDIEVDGGINPETARHAVLAGANILVAGSAIFGKEDISKAIRRLRKT